MDKKYFITCLGGMEPFLDAELKEIGIPHSSIGFRGITIEGIDFETALKINYTSRLATRVLLVLQEFPCQGRQDLYDAVFSLDWKDYFNEHTTLSIDANIHQNEELRNSLFVSQVVKDAICDQLREKKGYRPSVKPYDADVQLHLFIQNKKATISFDMSGPPLYKRGYREESVEAPLQESLAAALIKMANYQPGQIFLDPCAGGGTLLIEAALQATRTPSGFFRESWGFMHMPEFSESAWLKIKEEADSLKVPLQKEQIFGIEISKNNARICRTHLRKAGFHKEIQLIESDFRQVSLPFTPHTVITNPPHGKRIGEVSSLHSLYTALGDLMKKSCVKPGIGIIYSSSRELSKSIGLKTDLRHDFFVGGLQAQGLRYPLF